MKCRNEFFNTYEEFWISKVLCTLQKAGILEKIYMLHSFENCYGKSSDQHSIQEGLGGAIVNRDDAVKHYKKSEQKLRKELKALTNQNKIIFRIAKKSGSCRELNKIKNIRAKASKKQNKNDGVGKLPTIQKTYTLLTGLQNTLVVIHAENIVSLGTGHFWYGLADK